METELQVPLPVPLPLPRLRSGWPVFDELGLIEPGRVTLVDVGAEQGQRLLCRLLADAVATRGEAIVLDGGNWLDAYRLGDAAEAAGHSRARTLESVRVARGFTAYQLQSLAEDALPALVAERSASTGLVLVAAFPEMYMDEDMRPDESRTLAKRALDVFHRVAMDHRVPVLVSNSTLAPRTRHQLRQTLEENVDAIVGLYPAPHEGLRIVVPSFASVLSPAPGARQKLLGEFASSGTPAGDFFRRSPDARIKDATAPRAAAAAQVRFHARG